MTRAPAPPSQGLEVRAVRKDFAGVRALDEVSLRVGPDELLGLIGPNGSGKTTLVNVISGLIPPTSGSIVIDGVDVTGRSTHDVARHGVSRTFQNIRLFGHLSVVENVAVAAAFGAGRGSVRHARRHAHEVLDDLNLADLALLPASALSYGAQRRVEIARAVATGARYLLLDEPASGMNEEESDELLTVLAGLRERLSLGLLVIDHDLRLIMRLCDRLAVLDRGTLIREGSPQEVSQDPVVLEAYLGVASAAAAEAEAHVSAEPQ
jgi:ABC-type branched-subunit amino acid transport system ATPase component